ncbi:Lcl domain-containing protein [Leptospira sp. GIMC2001]|uniref:Lcl domain-containing protein n=1 Tax=Leptospira sp. GIMC2001 TaxID=1513297 RepID=UPI00234A3419|nr:DUF1566 domain-containing protein [Leptospira sp. GIMC2001]WCL50564.1 InlB B-repeat-containing protein [Leptospira sp. GIMC2001]
MLKTFPKFLLILSIILSSLSFQNCGLPSVSKEFQELSVLYRLISSEGVDSNTSNPVDSEDAVEEPIIQPSFNITYDGNGNDGGSHPEDSNDYNDGQFITILGNTGSMTLAGNAFVGWNTESDGSGDSYVAGNTIQVNGADIVLYAQWSTLPTYTITYDGNGNSSGTVPVDVSNYLASATVTVSGNTGSLALIAHSFTGWNTASDGSGTSYNPTDSFAMPGSNVTLYAQWSALPTFTVSYDGNANDSGTVPIDSDSYLTGETVTVLANTGNLDRTGFSFAGWNTASNGSGTSYNGSDTFTMLTANITLYAQWNSSFTVTYVANGSTAGFVPNDPNTYLNGDTVTVLGNPNSLVKSGKAWIGWNTAADGSGTTYTQGQSFLMGSSNISLYALYLEGIYAFAHFTTGASNCFDATTGPSVCPVAGFPNQAPETTHGSTIIKSLTDNGDETITDNITGLTWRKCPLGLTGNNCDTNTANTFNFADAQTTCQSFYGVSWRLPSIREMATLLDNSAGLSPIIDINFFPEGGSSFYTSTSDGSSYHFLTYFAGTISANTAFGTLRRVQCVQGPQVDEVINLSDEGNGTIRDNISGLIWQKCHSGRNNDPTCSDDIGEVDTISWQAALQYCDNLNLATYTDWRLPNRNELLSLVDFSITGANKFDTSLFPAPGFENAQMWSSNVTAVVSGNANVSWVNASFGTLNTEIASNTNRAARCVRGP